MAVLGAPALAEVSSEMQTRITRELESKDYVAKVELYDAEVTQTGKVSSEYDKESIKKGHDIIIRSVVFRSEKIRVKLKHPFVSVNTYVNRTLSSDFNREREAFAKMVAAVFEEKDQPGNNDFTRLLVGTAALSVRLLSFLEQPRRVRFN